MFGFRKAALRAALVIGALGAPAAMAEDGVRVEIRLPTQTELEAQKVVESLVTLGGEKQVKVTRQKSTDGDRMTLDLWGGTVPQTEIPSTLKQAFPALATATITVSTLPESERPALEREGDGTRKRIIIRKQVEKEQ